MNVVYKSVAAYEFIDIKQLDNVSQLETTFLCVCNKCLSSHFTYSLSTSGTVRVLDKILDTILEH